MYYFVVFIWNLSKKINEDYVIDEKLLGNFNRDIVLQKENVSRENCLYIEWF